jgi:hypothetical protein
MITNLKYIYTVLDAANKAKTKADKVAVLQKYNSQGLRDMLYCQYSNIEFILPEGAPPFDEFDSSKRQIPKQLSKIGPKLLKYFVKDGPGQKWISVRRERKFLDLIEVIHPLDAKVVIAAKDKKLQEEYPTVTKNVVQAAFPTLLGNLP